MLFRLSAKFYPHFLLIIFYFILHQFNRCFGLLTPGYAIQYALIYAGLGLILFLLVFLLTKNGSSASLITFAGVFIFIFFGNYHDTIKTWPIPDFTKKYSFQLSLIIIIFLLMIIFAIKRKWVFPMTNRFFLAMTAILCVWEIVGLGIAKISYQNKNFDMRISKPTELKVVYDSVPLPNIYFIVFDSYTSSSRLRKDFGFNNPIDSFLHEKGFFVADHSRSNYPSTALSVASTFNMNFLATDFSNDNVFSKMLKEAYTVANSDLPRLMKQVGYEFVNCSIFDFKDERAINGRLFSDLAERSLIEPTMFGRIWRDLGWQFMHFKKEVERVNNYKRQFIFKNLQTCTTYIKSNKPRFVYCHVMVPHKPYFFMADGRDRQHYSGITLKDLYRDQLVFTNTIIRSIVSKILESEGKNAVIILEGDHGYRDYENPEEIHKEFDNLNAYYFPDRNYDLLYDSISPVNSFRVLFNKYFGQSLPILRDSSINVIDPGTGPGLFIF